MRRTEALQGVRMTMFAPLGIGGAQSGGGGGVAGGERADIPALDASLRGRRRGRGSSTGGSARRRANGSRAIGRKRWNGFTASATRVSRSSISTSIG
jgi:hypothetical protein